MIVLILSGKMLSLLPFFIHLTTAASRGSLPTLNTRDSLGPIGTDSPSGITGGQIACAAPPVSSFFMGFDPPVRQLTRVSLTDIALYSDIYV
jgi:hypothetical protein